MMRLNKKVAIVTGAAAGIGFEIARRFAEEGAFVIAIDIDERGLGRLKLGVKQGKRNITCIHSDLSDEVSVSETIDAVLSSHGDIDILINNAARFVLKGISATRQDWRDSFSVNVYGAAHITQLVSNSMIKQKSGSIVNLASISGVIAQHNFLTYSATKATIIQMTKNLALDLGEYGIRVNCISPGTIITSASDKHAKKMGITLEEFKKIESSKTAIKSVGTPYDVANAALFLASDEARFITGVNLMVDGGYTIV